MLSKTKKTENPKMEKEEKPEKAGGGYASNIEQDDDGVIYFYADVNTDNNLKLNKLIRKQDGENVWKSEGPIPTSPADVQVRIASYGGYVLDAFGTIDYIKQCKSDVVTVIDGYAASAGTLISCVANKRYIGENSYMLIHQLSAGHWGNFEQLKDSMECSAALMERIYDIYTEHTKIPKKKLKELLKRDLWWDAKTCLEYGLVDDVI